MSSTALTTHRLKPLDVDFKQLQTYYNRYSDSLRASQRDANDGPEEDSVGIKSPWREYSRLLVPRLFTDNSELTRFYFLFFLFFPLFNCWFRAAD